MKKIELRILQITQSFTQTQSYTVLLAEADGIRTLPIVIGAFEAQAIAVAIEKIKPSRPLTHDLLSNMLTTLGGKLEEVVINNLQDGVFYALLVCDKGGETVEVDSRTSDAIALAVRVRCPIYTYDFVLDQAGLVLEETDIGAEEPADKGAAEPRKPASLKDYSPADLDQLLKEALENEDYEQAAKIRDEISKRSKN
jgi:bifunctional DNase/RNase